MFGDDVNRSPQGLGMIQALRLLPAWAGTRIGDSLTSNPNTGACKVAIQPIATLLDFHSMGKSTREVCHDYLRLSQSADSIRKPNSNNILSLPGNPIN